MALPCCLVHCEVRQTQSSLHHSTRHSSTIAFQFHPSSQSVIAGMRSRFLGTCTHRFLKGLSILHI